MSIPFNALVVRPVSVSPQQVAGFIPQGYTQDPALYNSLPVIIADIINTASSMAQTNFARTYYYNVLGQNDFNNQELPQAMSEVVDYVKLAMFQTGNTWGNLVSSATELVVRSRCALHAVNNQQLMASMQPQLQQETINTVNNYQQLLAQINTVKQTEALRSAAPAFGGSVGGNAGNFQYNPAHVAVGVNTTGIFPVNAPSQNNAIVSTMTGKNYGYLAEAKQKTVETQTFSKPMMKYPDTTPVSTTQPDNKAGMVQPLKWKPVPDQRYIPVLNSETDMLVETISKNDETGAIEVIYGDKILTEGEKVDRNQHQIITNAMVLKQVPPMHISRAAAIESSLSNVVSAIHEVAGKTIEERKDVLVGENVQYLSDVLGRCQNLSCAVFSARWLQKSIMGENYQCSAFRVDVILQKEFATIGDYRPFINELGKYKNLLAVAKDMRIAFEDINSKPELVQLVGKLDTFLTSKINAVFRFKMSLPDFAIDSFMYDIVPAFDVIKTDHGDLYQTALLNMQSDFIKMYLNISSSDDPDEVCLSSADTAIDTKYKPFVYGPEYAVTITCLDILSSELKLELVPGLPGAIIESIHPVLYNFVSNTILDAELLKKRNSIGFAAHYIVCADDVVFEIHRGLIGHDFYLISKHS